MERRRPVQRTKRAKTFSYYNNPSSKQADASVDLGKGRGVGNLRLLPTYLAAIVILFCILYSLTLGTRPSVELLEGQAPIYRPLHVYADAANEILSSKLSNQTKLTANTKDVEERLVEQFPEIRAVVLRLPVLGRKPSLVIDMRQPHLILASTTKVFVLDSNGIVVGGAGDIPAEAKNQLPVVRDLSGVEIQLGSRAVTSDTISFVMHILAQLKEKDAKVEELTFPTVANELDIKLKGKKYVIKTDTSGNPRLQIGSYFAVVGKGVNPREYVDVRVEEKVFYK